MTAHTPISLEARSGTAWRPSSRASNAEVKPQRPLGTAARHLVGPVLGGFPLPNSRPTSAAGREEEDELWTRQMRATIKSRGAGAGVLKPGNSTSSSGNSREVWNLDQGLFLSSAAHTGLRSPQKASRGAPSTASPLAPLKVTQKDKEAEARRRIDGLKFTEAPVWGAEVQERAIRDAKARASAYFEDLISFLEMHSLPGAYALALSANGVDDLAQLLMLEGEDLEKVITNCDLDAMDEILLRDALRGVSAR